jgi:Fe-S-cluster containining protein
MDNLNPRGDNPGTGACFQAPVPSKDLGHYCLACASQGHTCCQGRDIYVTHGDCARIGRHSRVADFFEYRGCSHLDYADQDDDPLWQQYVFRRDGSRRVLKRLADGNCLFLGRAGCCLPLTARPLVCRLYPHLYSANGIAGVWDGECPAAKTQASPMLEKGIAGVQWQDAVQWHRMLYSEILLETNTNDNWLNL